MPLGMEVGLSPGDFVLDGDRAHPPSQKGGEARGRTPNFRPMFIVPNGFVDHDATWDEGK